MAKAKLMLTALYQNKRLTATKGGIGYCPLCGERLIPKCGEIVTWHWAHHAHNGCDLWHEPETAWHLAWKARFPLLQVEQVVEKSSANTSVTKHYADVLLLPDLALEFQASAISPQEIQERENFYGNVVWIFNAIDAFQGARLDFRLRQGENSRFYWTFRWKHPKKSIAFAKTPFLDIGHNLLFHLRSLHTSKPCGGWGCFLEYSDLLDWAANLNQDMSQSSLGKSQRLQKTFASFLYPL